MLITIEGCVGAGKTTVAEGLAKHRAGVVLLEDFESNPFLKQFYADPEGCALETEFSFLLLHFNQLKRAEVSRGRSEIVSDFHVWKDLIYADLNVTDLRILRLFRELYGILLEQAPIPSLMIFLSASTGLIAKRIEQRRRSFELDVDPAYFARLNVAYEHAFEAYPGKKIVIPMDQWDFISNPNLFRELSILVDRELVG